MKLKLLKRFAIFSFLALYLGAIVFPTYAQNAIDQLTDYADNVGDEFTNIDQIGDRNLSNVPLFISSVATGLVTSDGEVLRTGMIPDMSNMMAFLLTHPPAQPSYYIADVLDNAGFAQPAYAQGIGFSSLTPVLQIWKAFRNMAYFFFILIFIVIGFMIMFRKQIDHQAVVTMQMALPKIIFTLILITLSYAIAGLVVDLIYLTIFVVTNLFQSFGIIRDASAAQGVLFKESIIRIGWHYFVSPWGEVSASAANSISTLIHGTFGIPGGLKFLTDIVAYAIVVVAVVVAMFRTVLTLLGAYVGIILSVIFAPIQLLFNAIPGSNTFNSWLRGLVANAAVFPAVAIMVLIGAVLSTGSGEDAVQGLGLEGTPELNGFGYGEGSGGFIPPLLISAPNADAFGLDHVNTIIGLGILMLLPEIAKIVKESLEVKGEYGEMATANANVLGKTVGRAGGMVVGGVLEKAGQNIGPWFISRFNDRANKATLKENQSQTTVEYSEPAGRQYKTPPQKILPGTRKTPGA